jgi:hypothetical protein
MPVAGECAEPNLEAKLAGLQSPHGWGLFLIRNLVDEVHITEEDHSHVIELIMHLATPGPTNQQLGGQDTPPADEQTNPQEEPDATSECCDEREANESDC